MLSEVIAVLSEVVAVLSEVVAVLREVVTVHSETSTKADVLWRVNIHLQAFLTVALCRRNWSASRPGLPNPGNRPPLPPFTH